MKRIFVCPANGARVMTIDKTIDEINKFGAEVYVRETDAPKKYISVVGITKAGRATSLVLEWQDYTQLAHILLGVERCDGVCFCGRMKNDPVCEMLFAILKMRGDKDIYVFDKNGLTKV